MVPSETSLRIRNWIADWFQRRGKHLPLTDLAVADIDYLDSGLMDSVMMIEFIMDLENEFRIRISSRNMADPRFSKLAGLVEIIEEETTRA